MTTRRKPAPRSRLALRSKERDVVALWESTEGDPKDLVQKVAAYQVYLAQKKAGRLPMYETIGRKA